MVAQLSKKAEGCKSAGNHAYFEKDFAKAVRLYSDAIHYAPGSALLYSNRSAALLGRGWQGDAWFALQDSEQALRINASSSKAVYRRIQALRALGLLEVTCLLFPVRNFSAMSTNLWEGIPGDGSFTGE